MSDYRIQIGTELDTKGIDTGINKYHQKKSIEFKSKLDTTGIKDKIANYKAKPIEVGLKLNPVGFAKQLRNYKPKAPIEVNARLNSKSINAAIKSYQAKDIQLNANLTFKGVAGKITEFSKKAQPIRLKAELNKGAINSAINDFNKTINAAESKTKIRIKAELSKSGLQGIGKQIAEHKVSQKIKIHPNLLKGEINQQITEFNNKNKRYINLKAKLTGGAVADAISDYKTKNADKLKIPIDLILKKGTEFDTQLKQKTQSYENKPIGIPVKLIPAATGFDKGITKTPVTVNAKLNPDTINTTIEKFRPKSKINVGVKLNPTDVNAEIAKLPDPTTPINIVGKLDEKSINMAIALFKPTATLGIQPDVIVENIDEQIAAYVPKAKVRVNIDLDENDIHKQAQGKGSTSPITVNVELNREKLNEQIKSFVPKSLLTVGVKLDNKQVNEKIRNTKTKSLLKVGIQIDPNDVNQRIGNVGATTPIRLGVELDPNGIQNVENQINNLRQQIQALGNVQINIGGNGAGGNGGGGGVRNAAAAAERAWRGVYNLYSQIESMEKKLGDLDMSGVNSGEISQYRSQLDGLRQTYQSLLATMSGTNGTIDLDLVFTDIDQARTSITQLSSQINNARTKWAKDIKINIDNGKLQGQINAVTQKFNQLGITNQQVTNDITRLQNLLCNMDTSDDIESVTNDYREFLQLLKTVQNGVKALQMEMAENNRPEILAASKESAMQRLNGLFENGSRAAKRFGNEAQQLRRELNQVGNVQGVDIVTKKIKNLGIQVKNSGLQTQTLGTRLKEQFSKYSNYLSIASVFMYATRAARSMFEQVKLIDSAMTELKKVTDETAETYNKFLSNTATRAKEIGTTIDGLVSSTADFARLGYGFEDSQKLAEVANIYAVVGDEIEGVEGATESLISTMAAFKGEMNDMDNADFAMSIIDIFNELGNKFAISSGGIGEALERSASSLAAANNSLHESAALITAANEVVQNPEKVGTAMKTVSMRIRAAKTEMEEAGIETEGMVESTAKLRSEIMALSGVDIMLDANNFKSTYQTMDELAAKWKDLSDIQQATIIELMAGKHQGNVFASLMTNFDTAREALETSLNSSGSAMKEHEKWQQSLEAQINKLKASWQGLSQAFMKSDFLHGALEGVIGLVDGLTLLIDKVGVIPTLFTGFAAFKSLSGNKGIFRTFNNDLDGFVNKIGIANKSFLELVRAFKSANTGGLKGFIGGLKSMGNALANPLSNTDLSAIKSYNKLIDDGIDGQTAFAQTMKGTSNAAQSLVNSANGSKVALTGMKTATIGVKAGLIGAKVAAVAFNAALTMGISLLIDFAISGVMKLINAEKELAEKVEEVTSKFKEQHTELVKNKSSFESQATRYRQLAKGVNDLGENVSLTAEEYAEYQSIVESIANQVPSLVSGYDSQGNAILNCKGNVEELTAAYEKLIKEQNKAILGDNYKDIVKNFKNKMYDFYGDASSETSIESVDLLEKALNGKYSKKDIEKAFDLAANAVDATDLLKEVGLADDVHWYSTHGTYMDAIADAIENDPDKVREAIANFRSNVDATADGMRTAAQAALSKAFDFSDSEYKDIDDKTQSLVRQIVGNFDAEQFKGIVDSGQTVEEYINNMIDSFKSMSEEDSTQLEAAFDLQTKFNGGDISYGEYVKGITNVSGLIDKLSLNDDIKSQIKLTLGLSEKDGKWVLQEYETLLERLTSKEYDIQLNTDSAESFLENLSSEELKVAVDFIESDNADFKSALQDYKDIFDEAKKEGVDFSKTVYGNIDTNARQVLEWNSNNLKKYKDELMSWEAKDTSWDKVKKHYEDTISTVDTVFEKYKIDNKEVGFAITPLLQTDNGAKYLSKGTVEAYMDNLISKAMKDGKWDKNEFLKLDAEGAEIDGQKIKGILADIGETAEATSKHMHFVGKDGALALAEAEIDAIVEKQAAINEAMNFTVAIDVETEGIEALNTAMAESVSGAGLSSESIAALKGRYAELESQGYDLSAMFEETANGIHLNKKAVGELEQKLASDKLAETDKQLGVLKGRYDELTVEIDNCTDASKRAALYTEQQSIVDKINDLGTLAAQYEGLTSAYNAWIAAEEAGSERDMYEKVIEGFKTVSDEISRGWVDDGTIKFLELLTGKTGLAGKSGKELKKIYDDLDNTIKNTTYSVRDFFTVDEDGNSTNTGVYNFLDAVGQLEEEEFGGKDVVKRDKDGNVISFDFELAGGDEAIAKALGIKEELVQIMLRAADDAGFVVTLEGNWTQFADLQDQANAANDSLKKLAQTNEDLKKAGFGEYDFDFGASSVETLESELEKAKELLGNDAFKDKNGNFNINAKGAKDALKIAETLQIAKNKLEQPAYMSIDTSKLQEELQEPVKQLQEFEKLTQERDLLNLTGNDKERLAEINTELTDIATNLSKLDDNTKIELGIDGMTTEQIQEELENGTIEIPTQLTIEANMDKSLKDLVTLGLLEQGLINEEEAKIRLGIGVESVDTSEIEEAIEKVGLDKDQEVRILAIAEVLGVENVEDLAERLNGLDDKQIQILAKVLGQIDVDKLKETIGSLDNKTVEAIAKALGKGDVKGLKSTINGLDGKTVEAIAKALGYDGVDELNTAIENLDPKTVQAIAETLGITDVDSLRAAINRLTNKNVKASATVSGKTEVDNLKSAIDKLKDKTVTIITKIKKIFSNIFSSDDSKGGDDSEGGGGVNGTANSSGSSFANGTTSGRAFIRGDWRTKKSQKALVGELGKEIVVTPNNKWHTVGDNGAEFTNIPKGSIVFNHRQTEELLKNGKATSGGGRAKALVNGTAFLEGTAYAYSSSGSGGRIEPEVESLKVGSETSSKDDFEDTFNAIETAISRIEREIDNLDQKANRTYKSWSSRNKALTQEISKIGEEIELQQSAYNRYMQEANSVGLSSTWAARVRNGTIDIYDESDYGESTAKKIKEYQEWYEKALACKDAIEDLKDSEMELYRQKFDNVAAEYDAKLGVIENRMSSIEQDIEQSQYTSVVGSNSGNYRNLISQEKQNIAMLTAKKAALEVQINEAVANGLAVGSEEWYAMRKEIDDTTLAIKESTTNISKYYRDMFDEVADKYDAILQKYEHAESMLNEHMSQVEAQGHIVSKNYYKALIDSEKANIAQLESEHLALIAARDEAVASGAIKKYSKEWHDMCQEIDNVTLSIEEGKTAILEYDNAIRQVDWEVFDFLQERISNITEEANFLIELMSNDKLYDDNGKLTNQGMATAGLHGQNYNVYMHQADKYGEEAARLDTEIASDPYDLELIRRRDEMLALQREMILAAEDEKQAIVDLVEEGINVELDALQERIDKYSESLDAAKDLYEYNKRVKEQTEEISSLEKQMAAYQGDDSEESRAKIQELKVALEDAKDDLEETEYDKYISDQKALLDELYLQYELVLNERLDNIDILISEMIAEINMNAATISSTISAESANVGYTLSQEMRSIWSENAIATQNVITMYGNNFSNAQTTTNGVLGNIERKIQDMMAFLNAEAARRAQEAAEAARREQEAAEAARKAQEAANASPAPTYAPTPTPTPSGSSGGGQSASRSSSGGDGKARVGDRVKFVSGQYYYDSYGTKPLGSQELGNYVYITYVNENGSHPYHISRDKNNNRPLGWLKLNQISGYATGKKNISDDEIAWTQEKGREFIVRPSDGAILTPVAKGDSVLNATASGNIWNMANSPAEFIKDNLNLGATNVPNNSNVQNNYTQHLDKVVFSLPNVKNYDELLSAMQKDPNFERLVESLSIGKLAGKSSLAKGKAIR